MKKTLGVISLAVLLSVQILTPITYAVGDEDFIETYVEESADEVVEATDESEEISDEVSDEDDVSEETDEEDSSNEDSEDEDLSDEDSEESDLLEEESDDSDSEGDAEESTGSLVESDSEEVLVLSEEDEAFIAKLSKQGSVAKIAEELGINWYTENDDYAVLAGIEGKYLGTKEQNNVIREYLISHAMEILKKSSSEETISSGSSEIVAENSATQDVELTGLNENEISGNKYYNGVTVNVLAPAKSFPEGTTLSITPIKKKSELKEIKEQLVESQDEVTEDSTVVAFDISFMYSGEEVQPVTGQTVQVTFNYENHEELTDANDDKDRALKVYHLNDKDEEGNKIDDINEVTVEPVDTVKNEEGELVVEAESFSIYTIVTQVAEEGPEAIEDQLANFTYGEISIARPDGLDVTEYQKEGFTIMDRNLGASVIGVGNEALTGSYGYYYQWGNNYGFSPYKNFETSGDPINVLDDEYKSGVFVKYRPWMDPVNTSLWQSTLKQGPCPTGWHVPDPREWSDLLVYYAGYYENENGVKVDLGLDYRDYSRYNQIGPINGFLNFFKIPLAGYISYGDASFNNGFFSPLHSSTLFGGSEYEYIFSAQSDGVNGVIYSSDDDGYYVGAGIPVRCFKDTYTPSDNLYTITFDFNGGSGSTAAIHVASGSTGVRPSDPFKSGFVFDNWYSGSDTTAFDFANTLITGNIILTAKYNCASDTVFDGEKCIDSNTVAYFKSQFRNNELKQLVGGSDADLGKIIKIIRSSDAPGEVGVTKEIGDTSVGKSITAWFDEDNGIIYYYTEATTIFFKGGNAAVAFGFLPNLTLVDLRGVNTSNVTDMHQMFTEDSSLEVLDLRNFDTSNVTDMERMFGYSENLKTVYVSSKFTTDKVTNSSNMFNAAGHSLVGGYGTHYNFVGYAEDKTFARIDNSIQSGFFTDPNDFLVQIYSGDVLLSEQSKSVSSTIDELDTGHPETVYVYYADDHTTSFPINTPLKGYTKLYAEVQCADGYREEGGVCTQLHTLTFDADTNGGVTETGSIQVTVANPVDLSGYTASKAGYTFVGWNTNSGAEDKLAEHYNDYTISEDTTLYAIFSKTVKITFDVNGNGGTSGDVECTMYNKATTCPITAPSIGVPSSDFTAMGWSTSSTVYENAWTVGQSKDIGATRTYYAWTHTTPSIYTATLTGGRGVAEVGVNQKQCTPDEVFNGAEVDRDCVVTLPSITEAAGYTGGLWSGLYVSGADYTLTANTTIKAIATPIIYHITYVGAEGHTEGFTGTYTVEDEVVLQRPSKSGWNFIDWHNNSLEGAVVTKISLGSTEDKTFYAEWTGKIFNINYVRNGATDIEKQEDSCQVTAGSKCSVTAPSITRDGFTILGWNKNPEAQTATVNVGSGIELDELTEDEHVTYYAITKKNIDVTFDVNGNGGLTSTEHCTIWNTKTKCPITAPDIIPYTNNTVIGWSIGSGRHDNDWFTGETKDLTESATYFAQTSRDISAKFMANNNTLYGDHNEDVTTFVERFCTKYNNDATCDIIVPAIKENPNTPTVVGYTVNASTGSDIASIGDELLSANAIAGNNLVVKLSSNNVPVYAQTEALQKVHHIIYEKGTGVAQIVDGPSLCTIPASYNGTEQAPSCSIILPEISLAAGYDTPNWGYTDGGIMLRPGDTKKITSDNVVLEAFSQSEHFIISYYLDGGTWNGASSSGSYQHGDSFSLPTPVKDGYTFIGWTNGTTITEPTLDIGISPDDSGAKVFYAHWLKDTDRIIYSNQGYDVTNLPTGHTYGYETIVPIPNGKRDGYQFSGWIGSNGIIPQKTVVISSGTRGELEYTAVWEPITYTIEYVNDGEEVLNPESFTIETPTFVLNNPTKANAEFDGWIVSGGTAPMKQIVIYKGSTENRKYTASFTCNEGYDDVAGVCTAHEYAVEYVKNGGEFMDGDIVDDIVKKEDGKYTIQVVNPIRTGFNFEGWSINMNSYTCKDASTSVSTCKSSGINPVTIEFTKGQNVTLMANWSRVDVEVTFGDVVDGHLMPGRETTSRVYTFDNGNVNLNAPRIAGYITSGWTTSLGGEKEYIDGMPTTLSALLSDGNIVFPTPTKTSGGRGNVTLYAIREPITYHIIYNLNGGTNDDANLSELTIEDHTLDLEDATKTGYDFSAWIDKYGVVKTQITKDLLKTVEAPYEIYLTAVWTPKTNTPYTVYHVKQSIYGTYNTGDATLTETLDLEGTTDSPVTPEVNSYVGFTSPQQTTKDIAPDGKMYIVYQYERDKYDYAFVNGVAGVISNGTSESAETYYEAPIVLSGKAEIGYTWSGWNIQSGDETLFVENEHHEFDMPLNNVTVTPVVIHNEYIMSYNVNGGTGDADALSSKIKYYNDSIVLPEVTREGYTFSGWWDESTSTKYAISPFNMPNNSLELTAHWEANPYTVTFHSNNGVDTTEVQNFVYDVAQDLRALSFEREGYTFLGWNTDASATEPIYTDGQSVINLRSISGDNLDLYAIWVSNVYTVTFHSNNGSDDTVVQNFVYDEAQDLTGLVFSKTGYSFTGWNTDASATEGIYADKQNVINLRSASGTNLDLYAIWEANDFTLYVNHFQMNLNGQYPTTPTTSGAIETKMDADITDGIAPNEYVGFELSGDAVTNIHIQPDGSSVINYYYIRNQYKVSVGENEGVVVKSGSTLSGTYYYDEDIHVEAVAIEGYTLSGWNVTSGGVTELVASGVVNFNLGTGDVDLVPVANINSYHLTVKDGETIRFSGDVVYKTNIAEHLPQLSKAGYTFNGWINRPTNDLMPAKDLVIEAKWTRDTPRGGGGGGGGGGGSSSSEKVVFVNTGDAEKEHGAADLTGKQLTGTNLTGASVTGTEQKNLKDMQFEELKDVTADQLKNVDRSKLTKDENEILDAYQWAYEHNVTTMVTLRDAMPEGVVTRGHLAKMVVNYATNVLGQKLPEKVPSECRWKDGAKAWESDEIKDYAVKACSLGLMGLDMDKFQPGLRVTRAQFGTIMSRLLWGKKYAGGTPYYRKHLNALKASNIMTQIGNPEGRVELRQWVWLMLMRAAMDNNK